MSQSDLEEGIQAMAPLWKMSDNNNLFEHNAASKGPLWNLVVNPFIHLSSTSRNTQPGECVVVKMRLSKGIRGAAQGYYIIIKSYIPRYVF